MSMKRSKQPSTARRGGDASTFGFMKGPEPEKTWDEQVTGQPDEAFLPYSLRTRYAKGALIAHPKFGKGAVVSVLGSTMEVLFADGRKKLGHSAS
jgi:hypothetical protein